MAKEMFDVLDENGNKTGDVASQREVHYRGLWHTGVHLCVTDGRGNVFQQLRGGIPKVRALPNVWDLFVATGNAVHGEEPLEALLRIGRNDIGLELSLTELTQRGLVKAKITQSDYWVADNSFPNDGYYHRTFDHNFVVSLTEFDPSELTLEAHKVLGIRRYPLTRLQRDLHQPRDSGTYLQHAHRPPDDAALYQDVLNRVMSLKALV